MSSRDEVLDRVRRALKDQPDPQAVPRGYRGVGSATTNRDTLLELLTDRLADYGATVHQVPPGGVAAAIAAALERRGAHSLVIPVGFPSQWLVPWPAAVAQVGDVPPLAAEQLDAVGGVITTCAVAVAETGTLALDAGPGQGRRVLTLVPDYHLVVVPADRVVATVPDAIAWLSPRRPLTLISGPSATSDIELDRVEGVHGPRTLEVLLVHERRWDESGILERRDPGAAASQAG
jgi:L-lactate dehydrogenase complex protein LldG